jgi:8-oxo-dGTP pyrophosphatase MutT (NUDIX family)
MEFFSGALLALLIFVAALYWSTRPRKRQRAGCVPLRVEPGGRLQMLLVQSRKHPEWWTFPAGGVERGEKLLEAASRETREEAGMVGRVGRRICDVTDEKSHTCMFALYVEAELEHWAEGGERRRAWFDLGVPSAPMSTCERQLASVRAKLSPKPVHQRVLKHVERLRLELAQEGEQQEARYGRPTRPGRRVGKS